MSDGSYTLNESKTVSLVVYNTLGQKIRVLVNVPQSPGTYSVIWDGHNELERGNPVRLYEGTDFKLKRIAEKGASDPNGQ